MAIYAIGDLHLSGDPPTKPMEKFGEQWLNHREKLFANWRAVVQPEDTVLLCGDISWSMNLKDAVERDFSALAQLPGQIVVLQGNHDYWWTSLKKMQEAVPENFHFLHNTFFLAGNTAICGTRGWNLPTMPNFAEHDELIYNREVGRLQRSLEGAKAAGAEHIIAALHYPPLYNPEEISGFTELCKEYAVDICVYGHVHGDAAHFLHLFQGVRDGTRYVLVASDYVDFKPVRLV